MNHQRINEHVTEQEEPVEEEVTEQEEPVEEEVTEQEEPVEEEVTEQEEPVEEEVTEQEEPVEEEVTEQEEPVEEEVTEQEEPVEEEVTEQEEPVEEEVFEQEEPIQEDLVEEENQATAPIMATIDLLTRAIDSLKSFRGTAQENSRDWGDRAEIIFNAYNINDADRLARIAIKLEDSAFDWYRDNQGPYASWFIFRQALERAFPAPERTQNKHLVSEQINQRTQGPNESVHDYYYALDQLCRQYDPNMSPLDKAIKLVGGLRDDLKEKLLPLNIRTPEDFMTQARNYESSEQVMKQQRRTNESAELLEPTYAYESNRYPTAATTKQIQQEPRQLLHRQQPQFDSQKHRQSVYQRPNIQQSQREYVQQQQQTFLNQQQTSNHRTNFNRQQPLNHRTSFNQTARNDYRNSNTNARLCYTCGKPGHFARNCLVHLNESQEQ